MFFFLTMPQITQAHRTNLIFLNTADEFAPSAINKASTEPNQSKSQSPSPSEKAKMGMYNAIMSALSAGSGLTTRSREHAEQALLLLESPVTDIEFYAKGIAYLQLKNHDLAIINFDRAIELNPRRYISYLSRGLAYRDKEEYDRAIADFDRAIELESKMTSTDVGQRKDDFKERYEKALGDFHKLVQLNPEPWFYWFGRGAAYDERGKAYMEQGDYNRAIADFNTLIQIDPNRADSYHHRGAAYGLKGDFNRAIADFDRTIELDPRLKGAHYNRGLAYELKGDKARARADFDKEDQLYPDDKSTGGNQNIADSHGTSPPVEKAEGELPPVTKGEVNNSSGYANILNERALTLVKPRYPALARAGHASGTVVVEVLIDEEGKVITAKAISGHPLLWGVSVEAAKNSLFSPTLIAGRPVRVTGVIQYNFVEQ
jgi:TonB family protein